MLLPWLKCRNVRGDSGEQRNMVSAGQGQVLKQYRVRHPFRKLHNICILIRNILSRLDKFRAENGLPEVPSDG
jgi:hypothetical protein